MRLLEFFCVSLLLPLVVAYTDDAVNLITRSSKEKTAHRYCVELARLSDGRTINISGFPRKKLHVAAAAVNACDTSDLAKSLPDSFSQNTLLVLTEHRCTMSEHGRNVEFLFGDGISLMILTNRTYNEHDLTLNRTAMDVSIPVFIFLQKDFNRLLQSYSNDLTNVKISIDFPLVTPKKFRPTVLLMFVLVFFILIAGNNWGADEFRKIISEKSKRTDQSASRSESSPNGVNDSSDVFPRETNENLETDSQNRKSNKQKEPAVIPMSYCFIFMILCFAISWLLLIYYFPKVMVYVLQGMFCIGAFSSLTSCLTRFSYLVPKIRCFNISLGTSKNSCKSGKINLFTPFAMIISLAVVTCWYVFRQTSWAWILQDILGAAICISILSVYRLGNMRVITFILLGFFLYDVFFVFITPHIPFFQTSKSSTGVVTTTIKPIVPFLKSSSGSSDQYNMKIVRKLSRNPSVMEQVALGFGTGGETVPLLFVLPLFLSDSDIDPCISNRKSMLGFGDVILPGILLTFCKIFDIAVNNRWPVYYFQSLCAYFLGLSLTHVALYLMNTAQPALLYLVPCILLSTILTGLCRGELKELYTGQLISSLLDHPGRNQKTALLTEPEQSHDDNAAKEQPANIVVHIDNCSNRENVVLNK